MLILLGAVVNVAVAWGCVLSFDLQNLHQTLFFQHPQVASSEEISTLKLIGWSPTPDNDHFVYELERFEESTPCLHLIYWVEQEQPAPTAGLFQGFVEMRPVAQTLFAGYTRPIEGMRHADRTHYRCQEVESCDVCQAGTGINRHVRLHRCVDADAHAPAELVRPICWTRARWGDGGDCRTFHGL